MKSEPRSLFDESSPIWKRPPFRHQIAMAEFHYARANSLDLSDVGTGKTGGMIAWMMSAFQERRITKALVIAPNSVLANWATELKINSDLTSVILQGTREKRIALLQQQKIADVYIINFAGLRVVFAQLLAMHFDAVIVDEIHNGKSFTGSYKTPTQAFLMRELGRGATYRRGMTGTAITNDLMDLWSILTFIDPKILRTNAWGFRQRFLYNKNADKPFLTWPDWAPRPNATEEIKKLLEPYAIRFEKREVLSFLPPVLFQRRMVELGAEQRKAYNDLKKHFVAELAGSDEPLAALNILTRVSKLLQIASGFAYREGDKPYHFKQNAKLAELKSVLEEIGKQRVIIWTAFIEEVELIKTALAFLSVPLLGTDKYAMITGLTKQVDRQPLIDRFNAGEIQYLVCHPGCISEGVTILAPYAVYYSRGWKLGERLQSLGRNDRPGSEQFENLTCIDLIASDTCDEEVMTALAEKKNLLDTINPGSWKEMLR